MTTPFKAKAEGVLVEVPEGATDFELIIGLGSWIQWRGTDGLVRGQKLPHNDWQLVGTSDTMTEDDWKGIVDESDNPARMAWKYPIYTAYETYSFRAKDSGHSLLPDPSKRYAVLILKENK